MSCGGWYSKKDVLKDLRRATGRLVHDLDERSVLVGEQPPPQRYNLPDDEAELQLLRLYGGCRPAGPESGVKPDLAGITRMVRMVNDVTEVNQEINITREKKSTKTTTDVLSISKLNPNVQEFVPMSSNISKTTSPAKETNNVKTELGCDNVVVSEGRIDKNQLTQEEIKEMKAKLKSKISDSSKATCVTVKRERNLAIASLIKLYSIPQESVDPKSQESGNHKPQELVKNKPHKAADQKLKLISPAYYEKLKECHSEKKSTVNGTEKFMNGHCSTEDSATCSATKPSTESFDTIEETSHSEIAASVNKVQKWLHDSEKAESIENYPKTIIKNGGSCDNPNKTLTNSDKKNKKVPSNQIKEQKESTDSHKSLYLGAVTFKRKASSKAISPTSSASNECVKSPKTMVYQPSKYASELTKTYLERSRLKEKLEQDLWSKLEVQLKAKDEEIKKQQAEMKAKPEDSSEQSIDPTQNEANQED